MGEALASVAQGVGSYPAHRNKRPWQGAGLIKEWLYLMTQRGLKKSGSSHPAFNLDTYILLLSLHLPHMPATRSMTVHMTWIAFIGNASTSRNIGI